MMQKLDLSDREYIMFLTLIIIDPGNQLITILYIFFIKKQKQMTYIRG